MDVPEEDAVMRAVVDDKVRKQLLPILFLAAMICQVNRNNLAFVSLQMQFDLSLPFDAFRNSSIICSLAYAIFSIPCSLLANKLGPQIGVSAIVVLCGIASCAMAFIRNINDLYILSFIVAVAQTGFFPTLLYYMSLWFSDGNMGLSYATVFTSTVLFHIIDAPLSGVLTAFLDKFMGISAWRWIFIVEGSYCILIGVYMFYHLDPSPQSARFLTNAQIQYLVIRQRKEKARRMARYGVNGMLEAVQKLWFWQIIAVWILHICCRNGISSWSIIFAWSPHERSITAVRSLYIVPYICAICNMLAIADSSDIRNERRRYLAVAAFSSACGFFCGGGFWFISFTRVPLLLAVSMATSGVYSLIGPFWSISTAMLSGDCALACFALINSASVAGDFLSSKILELILTLPENRGYSSTLGLFGIAMIISAFVAVMLPIDTVHDMYHLHRNRGTRSEQEILLSSNLELPSMEQKV